MINYIDKLRIAATLMVFSLHSLLFTGKNFPMHDILGESGGYFIFFTPAWGAVWIFFVLSGYLAGNSWNLGRYKLCKESIAKYYWKKIRRVYIPTIFYIICFCVVMEKPEIIGDHHVLWGILTSTFDGQSILSVGTGATWYIFALMWLYFTVPLLKILYSKFDKKIIIFTAVLCGLSIRLIWWHFGYDWQQMYISSCINMDLFICGFGVNYFDKVHVKLRYKASVLVLFLTLILSNAYMWAFWWNMDIYRYICETLYLILTCLYLHTFRGQVVQRKSDISFVEKFMKKFSKISFEFYLFHSLIFYQIAGHIGGHSAIGQWVKFILIGGSITVIFAIGWNKIFQTQQS